MNPGKCIVYLLLLFFAQPVFAQKKIVLEKIRSFAVNDPVITYWQKVETSKTIALQPSRTLVEHQLLPLADTTNVKIEFVLFDPIEFLVVILLLFGLRMHLHYHLVVLVRLYE